MASTEERLDRLELAEAIRTLIARYAQGADRRNDPAVMGPLFHDDAIWEAQGFSRYEGRDAIAAGLAEVAQSDILWTIHFMVSPEIEIDSSGARARCHWYLWELATMRDDDGSPQDSWLGGWYESIAERRAGRWAFSHVALSLRLRGRAEPPWHVKVGADV